MTTYYVAVNGRDSQTGTIDQPFASLQHAHNQANPGDTIYMRGGVYKVATGIQLTKDGTSGNPITIANYPGEKPVLDASAMTQGGYYKGWVLDLSSVQWNHIKGLEIKNGAEGGMVVRDASHNNVFEQLDVHHNGRLSEWEGKGITLFGSSSNNLFLNNDSHHNQDMHGDNADGFQIATTGAGNVLRGNRAWGNSDDGFDLFNIQNGTRAGSVLMDGNWAFDNGYDINHVRAGDGNGFKLGGGRSGTGTGSGGHVLTNNLTWGNPGVGFDENGSSIANTLINNTGYNNGLYNFGFWDRDHVFRNNLSFGTGRVSTPGVNEQNSWNLSTAPRSTDFLSLSDSVARGGRNADGSLPTSDFLHLTSNSTLIDKGVKTSLPYAGGAPDIGAYETGTGTANRAPIAAGDSATTTAGKAVTINVLANDTDPDGNALTLSAVSTKPLHGTATINSDGTVTYVPVAGYTGTDAFNYTVSDGKGGTAGAKVALTVTDAPTVPVPPAPTVPTTGPVSVTVNASGSSVNGTYAHFKVMVDGQVIGEAHSTGTAKNYTFTGTVALDAAHKVQVQFDNDAYANGQDRNLNVNSITINGKTVQPTSSIVSYDRGTLDGRDVTAGQTGMWWNGTLVVNADSSFFPAVPVPAAPTTGNAVNGTTGADTLVGTAGTDLIDGREGVDTLNLGGATAAYNVDLAAKVAWTGSAVDRVVNVEGVIGTNLADRLLGDAAANKLRGMAGNDVLDGRGGSDTLAGGDGDDKAMGGDGADLLFGGNGLDTLTGGAGNDTYAFEKLGMGKDRITDFAVGQDKLSLSLLNASVKAATGHELGSSYIAFVQVGSATEVRVDVDATGPTGSETIAVLDNVMASGLQLGGNVLLHDTVVA